MPEQYEVLKRPIPPEGKREGSTDRRPLLDENGNCRFCGLNPERVRSDRDQIQEFPTGHTNVCRGMLRGYPEKEPKGAGKNEANPKSV